MWDGVARHVSGGGWPGRTEAAIGRRGASDLARASDRLRGQAATDQVHGLEALDDPNDVELAEAAVAGDVADGVAAGAQGQHLLLVSGQAHALAAAGALV